MELIRKAAPAAKRDGMSFVLSDETPDRLGDVIMSDGWQLEEFRQNPIALFGAQAGFCGWHLGKSARREQAIDRRFADGAQRHIGSH